jgi:hypothetical protein
VVEREVGTVVATPAGTRALAPSPGLPQADASTAKAKSADFARDIMEPERGRAVPRSSERRMLIHARVKRQRLAAWLLHMR